jgi:hypothetical protein
LFCCILGARPFASLDACAIVSILQLERKGYFICDVPYGGSADKPAVLLSIPDGCTK